MNIQDDDDEFEVENALITHRDCNPNTKNE